jgi:hypothetical protein
LAVAGKSLAGAVSAEVASLAEGVLKAMLLMKVKTGVVVVLTAALLSGGGVLTYRTAAGEPGTPTGPTAAAPEDRPAAAEARRLRDLLAVKEKELHDLKDRVLDLEKQLSANREKLAATADALQASRSHTLALQDEAERARAAEMEARKKADKRAADLAARQAAEDAFVSGLRPAEKAAASDVSPPSARFPAEQLEQARDEVDILAAQVNVKRAQLQAAKEIVSATARVQRSTGVDAKGQLEIASLLSQVPIKEAELQEAQVRLGQAKRRLQRLEKSAEAADAPNRQKAQQRTAELEKKLDALGKELEALRRELKASGPPHP